MRFQGQKIGYVAGSLSDGKSVIYRLPHTDLSQAPRLGDLLVVCDDATSRRWLARVENETHVSIELHEQEVRNAIARGQISGTVLSDHEKEMYLGHDFTLTLLGDLRGSTALEFAPVVRSLPPRGSTVSHLKKEEIQQLVTLDKDGAEIGFYAVGDEVYDKDSNQIPVRFSVKRFVSRRTAIFGVAGFGKSNLMKNVIAELTISEPTVGKLVFDLDGEYSFGRPDEKGLADIPLVRERLSVYTVSKQTKDEYIRVIAGEPVLNLGDFSARKVVTTLLPESRQEKVYADLLRVLSKEKWVKVLDLVATNRFDTDPSALATILGMKYEDNLSTLQGMIRALVPMLSAHAGGSKMLADVIANLELGATVVIDLSQMNLDAAFNLTTFIVDEIFDSNQQIFVNGGAVPEIVVFVEEAQNLLSDRQIREGNPLVRLAKEGRKYKLGLVYVSQQPGAIAKEILSQTNNFFVLHLLSKIDIKALQDVNPHYEGIIADFIQMESLQGHAYIYSTVPQMPTQSYVFATKSTSFNAYATALEKRQPSGFRGIQAQRQEIVAELGKTMKELLAREKAESVSDGGKRYRCSPIAGELAKKVPEKWSFVRSNKNPAYVADGWIERICEELGFNAKVEWEDRKSYLHLRDKASAPPPVSRPNIPKASDEELPF